MGQGNSWLQSGSMKLRHFAPAEDLQWVEQLLLWSYQPTQKSCVYPLFGFFFSLFTFSCVVTLLVQYRNSCALHRDLVAMCSGTLQQNEICSIFNLPPQPAVLGMQHVRKTESGGCKKCIHTGNWNCSVIHSCSAENPSCNLSFLILVWLGPDLLLAQTGAALLTSAGVYQFAPGGNLCQIFSATRIREQM